MSIRELSFSSEYIPSFLIENEDNYHVSGKVIVVNLSSDVLAIDECGLKLFESTIIENTYISIKRAIAIHVKKTSNYGSFPNKEVIVNSWDHVYEIFPIDGLKNTNLWRSKKDKSGAVELNLWFASENTDCGIHNEHDFKELHTQVFGIGHMQKFRKPESNSLYQDVIMSPGYTHQPFYDAKRSYPWHQYKSDTDCIWLAIELYK